MQTGPPSSSSIVIVAYKPKPGKEADLLDLARQHVPFLRELGLATPRPETIMQAKDGTIVEIFEWTPGGVERAHQHPEIHKLWARYGEVCDYVPLSLLPEAADMFAAFQPLN